MGAERELRLALERKNRPSNDHTGNGTVHAFQKYRKKVEGKFAGIKK